MAFLENKENAEDNTSKQIKKRTLYFNGKVRSADGNVHQYLLDSTEHKVQHGLA